MARLKDRYNDEIRAAEGRRKRVSRRTGSELD